MTQTNPMRIYIEGNIGSGKTTFCKYLQEYFKGRDIGIVLEPLDRWLNTKDKEGINRRNRRKTRGREKNRVVSP